MADPVRVESLDPIPEGLRSHFAEVEVDGATVYEFRPPSSKTDEDVARTKAALAKERERARQLSDQLSQRSNKIVVNGEEFDPEEVQQLIEERRKRTGAESITVAEAEKRAEERLAKARSSAQRELEELKAQIAERDTQLDKALLYTGIASALASPDAPVRFRPEAYDDVQDFIRSRGLAKRNGQDIEVYDLDGKTPLTTAKGDAATLHDVLALVAAKKPHWVIESQGSGSQPPLNGSTPKKRKSDMSRKEKIDFIMKFGEEKFASLPD